MGHRDPLDQGALMLALVDCNSFYASCERVFRPDLLDRPVVVLSLNDGCVISMTAEAKALGLHVGAAAHLNARLFQQHKVAVFSANFPLYGEMSRRVMSLLGEFSPGVEVYSIDEAFVDLHRLPTDDLPAYVQAMRQRVTQGTGVPVSIGVAGTKTLAKAANRIAKKFPEQTRGIHVIDSEEKRLKALKWMRVGDVWGIGRNHAKRLAAMDVRTAHDFTRLNDHWIRKEMGIVGLRMKSELMGLPSTDPEGLDAKKNIMVSRSFETLYTALEQLRERVSTFAIACAEKLRRQRTCANTLMVSLNTNHIREDLPQYHRSIAVNLPFPTNSSIEISKFATRALEQIYAPGYHYKRAGVLVSGMSPEGEGQLQIFENSNPLHPRLMQAMDRINHSYGQHTVKLASQDQERMWTSRQEMLSPSYTGRMRDVIEVQA